MESAWARRERQGFLEPGHVRVSVTRRPCTPQCYNERTMTNESHRFIAHFRDDWYPVCRSRDLGRQPLPVTLFSTPLALFRDGRGGAPAALLDRCPHRNVPL